FRHQCRAGGAHPYRRIGRGGGLIDWRSCAAGKLTLQEDSMSFMSEFREFALKGSVVDLAVGVIIGAAFGKIVDSLVKDIIMPVIGSVTGGLDFTNYFVVLRPPPAGYTGPM